MSRIFFSYRRAESPSAIGRIYDRLTGEFGVESVFYDVETIPVGSDFPAYLDQEVAKCTMMIVVIGKEWNARIPQLHNEDDFVRIEIAAALSRKIPILPILVDSEMPASQVLPVCLQRLTSMNGRKVDIGQDFHHHMNKVVSSVKVHLHGGTDSSNEAHQAESSPASRHLSSLIDIIQDNLEHPGRISGSSTGFSSLDRLIGGLPNGETLVLASQHGKDVSILAQNMVQRLAIEQGKKVFWISTRDREIDRVSRILSARSLVTDAELKRGLLTVRQQEALAKAAREIQRAPIELFSAFSATVGQVMGRLNSLSRDVVDLLLIDDLLSLDGFDSPGMFRKLVTTARQREIPVICVARVNKAQRRSFDNPLESIDSGIEIMNEAAVTALLLLSDAYETEWAEESAKPSKGRDATLRVVKSDFGGLGDIHLLFNQELTLFTERIYE